MKQNMGNEDRIIRLAAAVVIAILYFTGLISGTLALILAILAVVFVVTSFLGFCPLYFPFGLSTLRKK